MRNYILLARQDCVPLCLLGSHLKKQYHLLTIITKRVHHKKVIAHFNQCTCPEDTQPLTHHYIAIPRKHLPTTKPNEYYWHDLIGLTVINQDYKILGMIDHFIATGANDVIVIKCDQTGQILIPYINQVIKNIDLDNKKMQVWRKN